MSDTILVINAGSSSIKFSLFGVQSAGSLVLDSKGQVEGMDSRPHFIAKDSTGAVLAEHDWDRADVTREDLLAHLQSWLSEYGSGRPLRAVGHRVVLGDTCYSAPVRITDEVLVAAGGLDALVFTAGIGEHAPAIRAGICAQSAWLGIMLDEAANRRGGPCISTPASAVKVWVISTNEALMIARHTWTVVSG